MEGNTKESICLAAVGPLMPKGSRPWSQAFTNPPPHLSTYLKFSKLYLDLFPITSAAFRGMPNGSKQRRSLKIMKVIGSRYIYLRKRCPIEKEKGT